MGDKSTPTMRLPTGITSAATWDQDFQLSATRAQVSCEAETYSRGSTKVKKNLALFQESILLIQLDELESGTSTISLLLSKLVPLVQAAFAMLLLDGHGDKLMR